MTKGIDAVIDLCSSSDEESPAKSASKFYNNEQSLRFNKYVTELDNSSDYSNSENENDILTGGSQAKGKLNM